MAGKAAQAAKALAWALFMQEYALIGTSSEIHRYTLIEQSRCSQLVSSKYHSIDINYLLILILI